jgi:formate hydrogenlyase subunit 3/multisubunit Na+/H+ antiporter MnhD subunit
MALLAACLVPAARRRVPALLMLAPLPALMASVTAIGATLTLPPALFGLTFALDKPGAMLLGASALLWIAAGIQAQTYLRDVTSGVPFSAWWLLTLAGNVGVFIAADLVSFYLFFTLVSLAAYGLLVSLAAYGLIAHDGTQSAGRATTVYVALAVVAEAFLIIAFVMLAAGAPDISLPIRDAVGALPASPWRDPALAFLMLGFGLKIGLVPLHVWMPLTYSAAPIPAAAVLSGAAVKAGVIGLIRFLPFETALPDWGAVLVTAGLFSAFYGVAVGVTQSNPKTVLAYSSVSQMGLLAAVLGMGLGTGDESVALAAAFYALHHILVKGGLFLCLAVVPPAGLPFRWQVLLPATVLALGLAGLPFSGGALAKVAVKAPLGDGIVGVLAMLSAIGSAFLMSHFLRCLLQSPQHSPVAARTGLLAPWLAVALAAVVLPWMLFPLLESTSWSDVLAPRPLWEALWPVLVGGLLAVGLREWVDRLPRIPEGDVLATGMSAAWVMRDLGAAMERIDNQLRQWPAAGVLFVALTVILAGAMLAAR